MKGTSRIMRLANPTPVGTFQNPQNAAMVAGALRKGGVRTVVVRVSGVLIDRKDAPKAAKTLSKKFGISPFLRK